MQPVREIVARAVPLDRSDVDTDQIIPSDWLKRVERTGFGEGLFSEWRESSDFVLNQEQYDGAEPVNVGTGTEIAIRDLAKLVAEVTGFDGEIVWDTSKPNGQPRRRLEVSRAEELFGFRARTPLREGLERTVAWYRSAAPAQVT